jgi:hypothetical protein
LSAKVTLVRHARQSQDQHRHIMSLQVKAPLLLNASCHGPNEILDDLPELHEKQAGFWKRFLRLTIEACTEDSGNTGLP